MNELIIKNLNVFAEGKEIIKNFSYSFKNNKVYAVIGPNGNGKSTLFSTIMGDPNYKIVSGSIKLNNENINDMDVDERAKHGIFLGMQYPPEIPGVKTINLLVSAINFLKQNKASILDISVDAKINAKNLRMDEELIYRDLNVGFSGGEKKKNEILQMKMLNPKFIMLDEIDSGLDVDSIKNIANEINNFKKQNNIIVIISHYKDLYEIIKPDKVLIIKNGSLLMEGNYSLLIKTLENGFDNF